jgi:hypothetical protein
MFDEMDARYLTINASLTPSSCRWLLDREEYKRWQDFGRLSEHHGLLWVKGKAGAGKSTLMKFAFNNAEKTRCARQTIVSFFFNARGAPIERSLVGMYRALLYQILHKIPHLRPLLSKKRTLSAQSQDWSLSLLQSVFQDVIESLASEHLVCYVDALDECTEDDVKEMVYFFEELGESSVLRHTKFHVCFASRHYPHITIERSESMVLEDQDGHKADISSYIKKKLRISNKHLKQEMTKQIEDRASGVFLWVVLVVSILNDECNRGNVQAIRARLKEIPTGLTDLIQDILRRDKSTKHLIPLLQWILFSRRPLSPEELFLALQSIEPETLRDSHTPEALTRDNVDKFILNTSKGLAEMTKGKKPKVQFIHELVRTHFLAPEGLVKLDPRLQSHLVGQSHEHLKKCCYNYIMSDPCSHATNLRIVSKAESFEGKGLRSQTLGTLPFLQYALESVLHHADLAHADDIDQHDFLEVFPLNTWVTLDNAIARYTSHRHSHFTSQAYILAEKGCAALLSIAMESHPPSEEPHERCRSILGAAVDSRDTKSVQAVLMYNRYINSFGKDDSVCMTLAIESDELEIVQALVAAKAKPYKGKVSAATHHAAPKNNALVSAASQPDKFGSVLGRYGLLRLVAGSLSSEDRNNESCMKAFERALMELRWNGDLEIVHSLYMHNHLPAVPAHMFIEEIRSGNQQMVQAILQTGIPLNKGYYSNHAVTPLQAALEAGHGHIVRCLPSKDLEGPLTLLEASEHGHITFVRLLLENGVDIEAASRLEGSETITALQLACQNGRLAIALLLIANGAKVKHSSADPRHPVFVVAKGAHADVLLMLPRHIDDINIADGAGRTPLSYAITHGFYKLARALIEAGADVHRADNEGKISCGEPSLSQTGQLFAC